MDYNKIYINSSNIIDNLESMYYKTDNICCPIIMHSIHNAIMTLMNIFLVGMILC